jgi:hypothetical protein
VLQKGERMFRNIDQNQSKSARRRTTAGHSASIFMLLFALGSCVIKRPLHLYPTGDKISDPAVLEGLFVGHGQGRGTARIDMPDGEVLQGEHSLYLVVQSASVQLSGPYTDQTEAPQ